MTRPRRHWHPCDQHPKYEHIDECLTGECGFCYSTNLDETPSGECRVCACIVCEVCDGGYDPDDGPICQPCAHDQAHPTAAG